MDSSWTVGNSSSSSSQTTTDLTSPLLVGQSGAQSRLASDPADERGNGGGGGFGGRTAASTAVRSLVQMLGRRRSGSDSGMIDDNPPPSAIVRDNAAEQLEERQSEWAYSRPVVVLDFVWNLAFVLVASAVLLVSYRERPPAPLRVWILGYALQCLLHILCVGWEYRRRRQHQRQEWSESASADDGTPEPQQASQARQPFTESESDEDVNSDDDSEYGGMGRDHTSVAKRFESANTMFSFIWWIVGFYWITSSGDTLAHDSPCLYWLCVVFLAFDVFFVVFCVGLACIIGIAVCCCLPCIIAILYAVADQDGASEEDINALPKYKFQCAKSCDKDNKDNANKSGAFGGMMIRVSSSGSLDEYFLPADKAECCICISPYDDNSEIRELPCKHHFDCACIDKWLRINATCPLCKYNILKSNNGRDDDV